MSDGSALAPRSSPGDSARRRRLLEHRITDSIEVRHRLLDDALVDQVALVAGVIVASLRQGGRVFIFGNGGSATDAGHLAAEMVGRYYRNRPALGALALADNTAAMTAIANDYSYEDVFCRQLEGLARPGDVAWGLSTSGNSANVVKALEFARRDGLRTIAFSGGAGGKVTAAAEWSVVVPSADTPRIQECHMLIGHTICEIVEAELFDTDRYDAPSPASPASQ